MRILKIHTYYQLRGGEDVIFEIETQLLRERGHEVRELVFQNQAMANFSPPKQALLTLWNARAYREVQEAIHTWQPDLVHVHNTFPLASPSVIHAAKDAGVPVITNLFNYRLLCVNALLFRQGKVCEACLGKTPWQGVLHGCYRNPAASAVVAGMLALHHALGTWNRVDRFITLTEFSRQKFIQAGLPPEKLTVKPSFLHPDPGPGEGRGGYALFVGRLSPEKGVRTLLQAWQLLEPKVPLKLVGDGPLRQEVEQGAATLPGVEYLGPRPLHEVYALMGEAAFLVFPSEWYETFGRVAIEAFAKGTPVLASDLGAVREVTEDGRTGLHFRAGDPEDLASKVEWLLTHPGELARMRREARAEYEAKYTAERNYQLFMEIYGQALEAGHRRRG